MSNLDKGSFDVLGRQKPNRFVWECVYIVFTQEMLYMVLGQGK
jgi:hypothetical protein